MTQAERDEMLVRIDDRVKDLRAAVFGNGQPGLRDRLTVLEQTHIALAKAHAECPARELLSGEAQRQQTSNRLSLAAVCCSIGTALAVWLKTK